MYRYTPAVNNLSHLYYIIMIRWGVCILLLFAWIVEMISYYYLHVIMRIVYSGKVEVLSCTYTYTLITYMYIYIAFYERPGWLFIWVFTVVAPTYTQQSSVQTPSSLVSQGGRDNVNKNSSHHLFSASQLRCIEEAACCGYFPNQSHRVMRLAFCHESDHVAVSGHGV